MAYNIDLQCLHLGWPNVNQVKLGVGSNIAQIHSSGLWEVIIYGHYWSQFTFDKMCNY